MSGKAFRPKLGIVGAGRWGSTLAQLAVRQGTPVMLYSEDGSVDPGALPLPPDLQITTELLDIAQQCSLVLLAIPAARLRAQCRALGEVLDGAHLLVHAVRGLDPASGALPHQVMAEETAVLRTGALLGAALVDELRAGRPNAAVIASRFADVHDAVIQTLNGPVLHVRAERDQLGIEMAAAGASALALALGLADGLGFGPAARAGLVANAAGELAAAVIAAGGEAKSAYGLAGLGYLLVEQQSDSRDVQAGRLLARGQSLAQVLAELGPIDAIDAAQVLAKLCRSRGVEAPMLRGLGEVLAGRVALQDAVAAYIR
jgi:glycerol-3-phosphate dehydrogenase (NAD(P)+)